MSGLTALVRKELRELRWFFAAGLVLFLGAPLTVGLYVGAHWQLAQELILWFGGAAAVFVAVGVICRDFSDDVRIFWQSRPIPVLWVLSIKWAAGLLVVLAVTCIPLAALVGIRLSGGHIDWPRLMLDLHFRSSLAMLTCHSFVLVAVYGVAFLLSCLLRQGTQAAVLSLAAGLLVYFAPALFPQLNFMDVFHVMQQAYLTTDWLQEYLPFCAGLLACTAATTVLAGVAVRRDWRIRMGRKTIAWLLAGVLLLGLAANVLRLGSALELERRIPIPTGSDGARRILDMMVSGSQGILLLQTSRETEGDRDFVYSLCRMRWSGHDVEFGPEVLLPDVDVIDVSRLAWSAAEPDRAYFLVQKRKGELWEPSWTSELITVALDPVAGSPAIQKVDLGQAAPEMLSRHWQSAYLHDGSLYLLGSQSVAILDVTHPDAPVVTMTPRWGDLWEHLHLPWWLAPWDDSSLATSLSAEGLELPSLTLREKLEVTLRLLQQAYDFRRNVDLDGAILTIMRGSGLSVYRLSGFDGNRAEFELVGHRQPTPLEKLTYGSDWHVRDVVAHEGAAYVWAGRGDRITAFDIQNPQDPRRTGHFVLTRDRIVDIAPLAGNRLLVAGRRDLYVVRLPEAD